MHLWLGGSAQGLYNTQSDFECSVDRAGQFVIAHWHHAASGTYESQKLPVAYWPTAVAMAGADLTFCVAGKRDSGATIIEQWTLRAPNVSAMVSPATGKSEWVWQWQRPESITTLYDEATRGRDMIEAMAKYPGEDKYIVKFYDSNDVFLMKPGSGLPPELIASPHPPAGSAAFEVSQLEELQPEVVVFKHQVCGYGMYLTQESRAGIGVVFFDEDTDGDIDGFLPIETTLDWQNSGLSDGTKLQAFRW